MLNKLRRVVALIMIMIMASSSLISCGSDKAEEVTSTTQNEYLTRGEWITQLAEAYGMYEYDNQTPYYSDVTAENAIFPYVQSCYEWNVLSTETDKFKPDDVATLGFVVSTSVLAAELDYEEYATSDDVNESIINCANATGITNVKYSDSDALTQPVDRMGAQAILTSSVVEYTSMEDKNIVNVEYRDTVVDGNEQEIKSITEIGNNNKVPVSEADKIEVGSILLLPGNEENPFGYCLKVVSKSINSDGTYTIETEEPEIYEVFESMEIDRVVETTPEMFTPAEGVTVIDNKQANNVANLGCITSIQPLETSLDGTESEIIELKDHNYNTNAHKELELEIELANKKGLEEVKFAEKQEVKGFLGTIGSITQKEPNEEALKRLENAVSEIDSSYLDSFSKEQDYSFVQDYVNGKISEDEFKDKLKGKEKEVDTEKTTKDSKNKKKVSADWKVTGSLSLETKVTVDATINFIFFDTIPSELKNFEISVQSHAKEELTVEGSIEVEPIKIGSFKIPIAYGFGLELGAYIEIGANGKITYSYEVGTVMKVGYKDKKIKTSYTKEAKESFGVEGEVEAGLKLSGTLTFWGFGLAEVGVKISGKLKAEAGVSRNFSYGLEQEGANLYYVIEDKLDFETKGEWLFPLLTLTLGGDDTLLGLLGIEVEYKPINDKNANSKELWKYNSSDSNDSLILFSVKVPLIEEKTTEETTIEETTTGDMATEELTTQKETTEETTTESQMVGMLSLSEFAVIMNVGETKTLQVTIPEGYSADDLVWTVSDGANVTVVNGTISAIGEGTSTITVKTADGKNEGKCVVVVN